MNEVILAIESSCDDTSIALLRQRKVLANVTANQQIHAEYGGVVPEFASRAHQQNIVPTLSRALKLAKVSMKDIDAIAFTAGPGLLGSLLVGTSFAKSLSLALGKPLIEVNHMQAHILSHFIENESNRYPKFPFLCLTVSGGHSQIVKVNSPYEFQLIGETLDDAAGEAFDKSGKMMGLEYPAGPVIDKLAQDGNSQAFNFAKPKVPAYNYSFSGLKTSVLYFLQKQVSENPNFVAENLNDLAASIQRTIIDVLLDKLTKAAKDLNINEIAIAGGVSANSGLREALQKKKETLNWEVYIPDMQYCTDNGGMIGVAAYYKYLIKDFANLASVAKARKPVSTIS
jgi:N6-L-threonylcarbamoyladenine synthase